MTPLQASLAELRAEIAAAVDRLVPIGARCAVVGLPYRPSVDDSLRLLGETAYLLSRLATVVSVSSVAGYDEKRLRDLAPEVILIHGPSDASAARELERLTARVRADFSGLRVVQFAGAVVAISADAYPCPDMTWFRAPLTPRRTCAFRWLPALLRRLGPTSSRLQLAAARIQVRCSLKAVSRGEATVVGDTGARLLGEAPPKSGSGGRVRDAIELMAANLRETPALIALLTGRVNEGALVVQRGLPFYATWFSCAPDFQYLSVSLQSFMRQGVRRPFAVVVVEDRKAPFSDAQVQELRGIAGPSFHLLRTTHDMSWGGLSVLASEIAVFRGLARQAGEGAWICKIDSDVAFFGTDFFQVTESTPADLIGQPSMSFEWPLERPHVQGGCYLLRASTMRTHQPLPLATSLVASLFGNQWYFRWHRLPEDYLMTRYIEACRGKVEFVRAQCEPNVSDGVWRLEQAGRTPPVRSLPSFVHFEAAYKRLMLADPRVQ